MDIGRAHGLEVARLPKCAMGNESRMTEQMKCKLAKTLLAVGACQIAMRIQDRADQLDLEGKRLRGVVVRSAVMIPIVTMKVLLSA